MPCDQIRTTPVNLAVGNKNPKLLKQALESMGYTVGFQTGGLYFYGKNKETGEYTNGEYADGELTQEVRQGSKPIDINKVKKAYAVTVVHEKAKKWGWKITKGKSSDAKGVAQ